MKFEHLAHPAAPADRAAAPADRALAAREPALETGRNRLLATAVLFALAFLVISGRLADLTLGDGSEGPGNASMAAIKAPAKTRADIVDRNGILLATNLPTASLYANPRLVPDPASAAARLARVLPGLDHAWLERRLGSDASFVWLKRNLTPRQHHAVNGLGIPGLDFQRTERRVYPHGRLAAHVLGLTDIDGNGISGTEGFFDTKLRQAPGALELSLDIRIQSLLRNELKGAMDEFSALGAAGVVLDVRTGETLAMVSLPDFNPNRPENAPEEARFNRVTKGVYEMGSTFKLFTTAMALDNGTVGLTDGYDASRPIRVARFTITDFHGRNRWLSVPEILIYSSNIGAAKMAMDVGTATQRAYLRNFGLLRRAPIQLPEVGRPLSPARWRRINTMTISYGHGIAVSPLQLSAGVAAIANGGILGKVTLLKRKSWERNLGTRVLNAETSAKMRRLMRQVVKRGTGRKADVTGYAIGGKTGTADKPGRHGYGGRRVVASFVGAFPIEKPRFLILALVDEPKGTERTHGYATGGWVAAPVVRRLVRRMAPLVGLGPEPSEKGKAGPVRKVRF